MELFAVPDEEVFATALSQMAGFTLAYNQVAFLLSDWISVYIKYEKSRRMTWLHYSISTSPNLGLVQNGGATTSQNDNPYLQRKPAWMAHEKP